MVGTNCAVGIMIEEMIIHNQTFGGIWSAIIAIKRDI